MTQSTAPKFASSFSAGLRALADLLDRHPTLAQDLHHTGLNAFVYHNIKADQPERLASWVQAAKKLGAAVSEETKGNDFKVHLDFGSLRVSVWVDRDKVCEQVVVGTETVDKVEWRCPALLAGEPVAAGSAVAS